MVLDSGVAINPRHYTNKEKADEILNHAWL